MISTQGVCRPSSLNFMLNISFPLMCVCRFHVIVLYSIFFVLYSFFLFRNGKKKNRSIYSWIQYIRIQSQGFHSGTHPRYRNCRYWGLNLNTFKRMGWKAWKCVFLPSWTPCTTSKLFLGLTYFCVGQRFLLPPNAITVHYEVNLEGASSTRWLLQCVKSVDVGSRNSGVWLYSHTNLLGLWDLLLWPWLVAHHYELARTSGCNPRQPAAWTNPQISPLSTCTTSTSSSLCLCPQVPTVLPLHHVRRREGREKDGNREWQPGCRQVLVAPSFPLSSFWDACSSTAASWGGSRTSHYSWEESPLMPPILRAQRSHMKRVENKLEPLGLMWQNRAPLPVCHIHPPPQGNGNKQPNRWIRLNIRHRALPMIS